MLFSTVSANLLLLSVPSVVMAGLIPMDSRDVQADAACSDLVVIVGGPELVPDSKRSLIGPELPERRDIFPRAINADQKESLRLHNVERKKKKVGAMVWSPTLAGYALTYAKKLAKDGKLAHSAYEDRINQGENLAFSSSSVPIKQPGVVGTNGWIAERPKYKNEVIPKGDFSGYGHYTQVMWNTSTRLGIASASDGKGGYYTVARYSKPGNIVGLRPY
ncbi:CAP domain-containing protein [Ilyonectria sp. MPI-CAGE-AT-0026]|nr:CAP domain-containing protein [Ilyonectria sp. MPI-CAGE-AT-0026]